jgi:hypothetical protein
MSQKGDAWRILFEGFSCAEQRKKPARKNEPVTSSIASNDMPPPQTKTVTPRALTVECAFSSQHKEDS